MTESPWNKSADAPTVADLENRVVAEVQTAFLHALERTGLGSNPRTVAALSMLISVSMLKGTIKIVEAGFVSFDGRHPFESTLSVALRHFSKTMRKVYRHDPT